MIVQGNFIQREPMVCVDVFQVTKLHLTWIFFWHSYWTYSAPMLPLVGSARVQAIDGAIRGKNGDSVPRDPSVSTQELEGIQPEMRTEPVLFCFAPFRFLQVWYAILHSPWPGPDRVSDAISRPLICRSHGLLT
jgi:hypothetical protein